MKIHIILIFFFLKCLLILSAMQQEIEITFPDGTKCSLEKCNWEEQSYEVIATFIKIMETVKSITKNGKMKSNIKLILRDEEYKIKFIDIDDHDSKVKESKKIHKNVCRKFFGVCVPQGTFLRK